MLEIGILFALGPIIYRRARARGQSGAAHLLALIVLWFIGEAVGAAMLGAFLMAGGTESAMGGWSIVMLLMPYAGGAVGAAIAFSLVKDAPENRGRA